MTLLTNFMRNLPASIGESVIGIWNRVSYLISVSFAIIIQSLRPINWRRSVRNEFIRQCYFTGALALNFIAVLAVLVGLGMVFQAIFWLSMAGQEEYIGTFIVLVLVREIVPILVALILIGRSGSAIVAELGTMRISGQVRMLDAQGIDPFIFLVLPRATAMALCMFCLTVAFLAVALGSGFVFAQLAGIGKLNLMEFINIVLIKMGPSEYAVITLKTIIPGLIIGVICCINGLGVTYAATEVPRVLPETFTQCVLALFVISVCISVIL
jgi:phospholipid/cholesterol/gamma-HCH transport system permease protein